MGYENVAEIFESKWGRCCGRGWEHRQTPDIEGLIYIDRPSQFTPSLISFSDRQIDPPCFMYPFGRDCV